MGHASSTYGFNNIILSRLLGFNYAVSVRNLRVSKHHKFRRQMVKELGKYPKLLEANWEEGSGEDFKENIPISMRRKRRLVRENPEGHGISR